MPDMLLTDDESRRIVVASAHGRSNRYRLAHAELDQLAGLIGTLDPGASK
jgi:hypothetical protein